MKQIVTQHDTCACVWRGRVCGFDRRETSDVLFRSRALVFFGIDTRSCLILVCLEFKILSCFEIHGIVLQSEFRSSADLTSLWCEWLVASLLRGIAIEFMLSSDAWELLSLAIVFFVQPSRIYCVACFEIPMSCSLACCEPYVASLLLPHTQSECTECHL